MLRIASRVATPLLTVVLLGAASACRNQTGPIAADHANARPAAERIGNGRLAEELARDVRRVTARFSSTGQATRAGYAVASPCVSSPTGGMGFHWVDNDLVDPALDPMHPEALLYAPRENGRLELVGVEYIVVDVGQPAPTFGGRPFDIGGTPLPVPHWSLHVWLFRPNASGLFAPFNPSVVCP